MSEEHAVATFIVIVAFVLYCLMSLRDVPTVVGHAGNLPSVLQKVLAASEMEPSVRRRQALERFVVWTAFLQFVPVAFALSFGTTAIPGTASIIELAAAALWTTYLIVLGRRSN